MGRLLALDYGLQRTGIAVTDPLKIIATALDTVPTRLVLEYLQRYCRNEAVEAIVLGMPRTLQNTDSPIAAQVRHFREELRRVFPDIPVYEEDERLTSRMALHALRESGLRKKQRRQKGQTDKISAVLILQSFMARNQMPRNAP